MSYRQFFFHLEKLAHLDVICYTDDDMIISKLLNTHQYNCEDGLSILNSEGFLVFLKTQRVICVSKLIHT